ncbi:MAG: hypothetical protein KDJ90_15830 [Nitratireductor sp.]|nr:hypothetical protein [Nitratireductor sp.]
MSYLVRVTIHDESFPQPTGPRHGGFCEAGAASLEWGGQTGWKVRPKGVAARFVVRLVACAMQANEEEMLSPRRGTAEAARARQVVMYLLHTSLSISYADIADMFERDRTTVSHACRTIEDLRDDPMHDDQIASLEEMVDLARSMSAAELGRDTRRAHGTLAGS